MTDQSPQENGDAPTAKRTKRKKPLWRRILVWTLVTGTFLAICGVVTLYVIYRNVEIPDANAEFQTQTTKVYYSDGKHKIGDFRTQNRTSIPLDEMPDSMQAAVVAAEDRTFYTNKGIDFKGIIRAARNNATSDTTQGASTITQQYVKVLYLTQERSLQRKVKEAFLSLKVHNELSKDEILEGYLNTIYFGQGAYGVEAASETYFGHPASELTVQESALLASVINNPSAFDPYGGKEARQRLLGRYQYVLDGMASMGAITEQEAAKYGQKLPKVEKQKRSNRYGGQRGYLLRMTELGLQKEGFTDAQINGGGLKVVTTFDRGMQRDAVQSIKEVKPEGLKGLHIALSSIDPSTGALRAMYGGKNYIKNQYNWAVAGAQPGSSFKPFAVAAALEDGYSLDTSLNGSSPLVLENGDEVENQGDSGGESFGSVSLKYATEESINTAFVDLTWNVMENGNAKLKKAARAAGVSKSAVAKVEDVPIAPLGYTVVPNIDMASAYATFANEGEQNDWYVVQKVKDPQGETLMSHKVRSKKGFSKDIASDVTDALQGVVAEGTGRNGDTVCPTAGKTGTATAQKVDKNGQPVGESYVSSSWFVGFTPKLSTAVMYVRGKNGNGQLDGYMPSFYGGSYPAETFRTYMNEALDSTDCGEFPEPAHLSATKGQQYVEPAPTTEAPEQTEQTETPQKTQETQEPEPTTPPTTEPTTPPTTEPTTPPTTEPTTPPTTGGGGGGNGNGNGNGNGGNP